MAKKNDPPAAPAKAPPAPPAVGDFVHYVAPGGTLDAQAGAHRAALVTALHADGAAWLKVSPPLGTDYRVAACLRDDAGKAVGTWHAIER